jgi:hypothetical protein
MAATSPYSPNDYQATSNFRPYELPINDIYKAVTAQNQFWDAGAARVKSVYDNALNLKLSLEPNKEIRKKYMEDAEKQLTKLSSMDLSDPAVQRQGFALFKPLFQDEGIIYDDLTTRHYEKVRNDALMYRSKDNGKGYSDINMQYAMQGYNEFVNSADRMAGKQFYENRKEYTPFYDYTEDFSKALKDCKPSSAEGTSPNYGNNGAVTGYMKESYVRSLSASQVRGCLEAGLSTNGARQLQIEGAVSYRNHPDVLASDTTNYLSGVTANLSTQLQQLSAQKAALATRKDITDADKLKISEALDNQIKGTTEELDKTNHSVSKLVAGDYTDMLNNYDNYAGSVYSYKKLYKKALASSFEDRRETYKVDPVQLNAIKFSQDKYLNQLDYAQAISMEQMKEGHDKEMKLLDLMYGGGKDSKNSSATDVYRNPLTGEITLNPNLMRETPNLTDKPEPNKKIYNELTNQVSALNEQDQTNNLRLYNNLITRGERDKSFRESLLKGFNYGVTDDEWIRFKSTTANNSFTITREGGRPGGLQETSWFKAYSEGKPDDEDVNKWSYDNTVVNAGLGVLNRKLELGEKQVANELGGDFKTQINNNIAKIKPVVSSTGIIVTPTDMQSVIEGKSVKGITVGTEKVERDYGNRGLVARDELVVRVNGQVDGNLTSLYKSVNEINNNINSKLNAKRVEVYNKLGFDREQWYFTPNEKAPLVQTLKSVLPKDEKGKDMDVSIISSDFSGGVRVSVPGVKKGGTDYLDVLRNAGVGTSVEATGDNIITIKGTTYNVIQQAINNPVLGQAAYQLSTIGETTAFAQTQPGAKVPNSDITVPVMVRGKQERMTIETYKNDTRPEYRVYLEGATSSKPIVVASNAYELFEKIGRTPVDLNKPIR